MAIDIIGISNRSILSTIGDKKPLLGHEACTSIYETEMDGLVEGT
jgi:hypothetical protein